MYNIMYCEQTVGPRSVSFCTQAYWQYTFSSQFSSKSPTSLNFNFKVKDSNPIHWQVHTWNQHEMHSSLYQRHYIVSVVFTGRTDDTNLHAFKGVRSQKYTFCYDVSLIFMQNATHYILAYGIRRSVSVQVYVCICVRVCVYVCVYSSVWTPHWWNAWKWFEINQSYFSPSCRPLKRHQVTYLAMS